MRQRYLLALLLLAHGPTFASVERTVAFSLDNDGIFGVDQDYTNGVFLSYTSAQIAPAARLKPLSLSYWGQDSLDKWALRLAHKIWTPSDIEAEVPLADDRPYAGYLYGELSYLSLTPDRVQRVNFMLGVTGDHSYADETQNIVHGITGSDDPNGWAYQIDSQIAGSVGYVNHLKLSRERMTLDSDWELSNISQINVGNFRSDIATGLMLRWGRDLAHNMGAANITAEQPFQAGMLGDSAQGWFAFTGMEARYRFNDLTIEGDRPGIEHNASISDPTRYAVSVEHLQTSAVLGIAWYNQNFGASFTTTLKTAEYQQASSKLYGTGGLSLFAFF